MNKFHLFVRPMVLLFGVAFTAYVTMSYATKRNYLIKVIPDTILSSSLSRAISSYVLENADLYLKRNRAAHELLEDVKQKFPFIERIVIKRKSSGVAIIALYAARPLAFVNNYYVLNAYGDKVLADYYIPALYQNLFSLRTVDRSLDTYRVDEIRSFVHKVPSWLFEHYDCEWFDKTCIHVKDNRKEQFLMKVHADQDFGETVYRGIERAKDYCLAKNAAARRRSDRNALWSIDMRFKNQLILSRLRGGLA